MLVGMRALAPLVAALAAALVLAAPAAARPAVDPDIASGAEQQRLDAARALWRSTGIRSYRFRVARECFCSPRATKPAVITVRDGRPVDQPRWLRRQATIPRLFRVVQRAIDARVDDLTVRYGRERGIPRRMRIDPEKMLSDEEVGYVVDRFREL
jgi:hypothetical protein